MHASTLYAHIHAVTPYPIHRKLRQHHQQEQEQEQQESIIPMPSSSPSPWEASLPSTDSQLQRLALLDAHTQALLLIDKEEDEDKQSAVPGASYSPSFPHVGGGKSEQPAVMWAGANRGRVEGLLKR